MFSGCERLEEGIKLRAVPDKAVDLLGVLGDVEASEVSLSGGWR